MVDIFSLFVGGNVLESSDGTETSFDLKKLCTREDSCCCDNASMSDAGLNLIRQQPPVKRKRPLPLFELLVERLAEAAGPHLACGF